MLIYRCFPEKIYNSNEKHSQLTRTFPRITVDTNECQPLDQNCAQYVKILIEP